MAARKRLWIPAVPSSKMVRAYLLLFLLVGLPRKGEAASSTVESKSPTAKECRAHVEKALDQYFDSKGEEGDQDKKTREERLTLQAGSDDADEEDEDDDDDDDPPVNVSDRKAAEEANDEDDEDEEDEDEDDDEEDDDEDEDEEEKEEQKSTQNRPTETTEREDENEEDEEDEDDEDEDEPTAVANDTKTVNSVKKEEQQAEKEEEEEDEDEDEDEEDEEDDDEDDEDQGKAKEDEDEDEEVDEDEDEEDEDEEEVAVSKPEENGTKYGVSDDAKVSENVPLREHPEEKAAESGTGDDEEEDDEDEEDDEEDEEADKGENNHKGGDYTESKVTSQTKPGATAESEKATGASYPSGSGVAQELPERPVQAEQPKAEKEVPKTEEVLMKQTAEGTAAAKTQEQKKEGEKGHEKEEEEDDDDDSIENIYEEEEEEDRAPGTPFRSRDHIDAILALDDIGTGYDQEEEKLAQSIFREIKKIYATSIKPMEMLYKYADSTTRLLGDAEIFMKPMILFLGPWSTGKTTIINYLLGIERTPAALKTGTGITDVDFTIITYGDQKQTISGTELAADWRYASVQKFGQGFLDHFKAVTRPHTLLKKVNLVDTPGILENRKNTERGYPFNDAFQWFIDRADAVYVVLDPTKVDIGAELGAVLDQLKGREVRFILNKADTIRRSDLMRVVGQLFWNLSPLMSGTEAPVIYAVSLSTKPFSPSAPAKFLADQERNFLYDLKDTMDKRVENRILYARRHAVRVRNHAKMVDCYLATYYRHKSIFSSKKNIAKQIIENPLDYHIYDGISGVTNVSRYDLPDATTYKNFFRQHPLYDFKPLASTCSYFRGCPMDKLDNAIAVDLPELFSKYKKLKNGSPQPAKHEQR